MKIWWYSFLISCAYFGLSFKLGWNQNDRCMLFLSIYAPTPRTQTPIIAWRQNEGVHPGFMFPSLLIRAGTLVSHSPGEWMLMETFPFEGCESGGKEAILFVCVSVCLWLCWEWLKAAGAGGMMKRMNECGAVLVLKPNRWGFRMTYLLCFCSWFRPREWRMEVSSRNVF